jgi:hypothetical protein
MPPSLCHMLAPMGEEPRSGQVRPDSDDGERIDGAAAYRVVTFDFDGHAGEIGTFGKFDTASRFARTHTRKGMATALLSHPDEPLRVYARGRLRLRVARTRRR